MASAEGFEAALASLLNEQLGFTLGQSRAVNLGAAVTRTLRATGLPDGRALLDRVREDPRALERLVDEVVIGETYFHRSPGQLDFIRKVALPSLVAERPPAHRFRVWSAGCATGEEPYTLAMLFEEEALGERVQILGTDISRASLSLAESAVYGPWSLRATEEATRARYFRKLPGKERFALDERLRQRVAFEYLNLALDRFPSFAGGTWGMDLVLCRNVLIYFRADLVLRVAEQLAQCVAEGGYLVLGPSDPPLPAEVTGFERLTTAAGLFYRRGGSKGESTAARLSRTSTAPARVNEPLSRAESPLSPVRALAPEPPAREVPRAPLSLDTLRAELARGNYDAVLEASAEGLEGGAAAPLAALRVRALASARGAAEAETACADAVVQHPMEAELHLLHAAFLAELGHGADAVRALRRVLYLEPGLAVGHFLLGSLLQRSGDRPGAIQAFRNARSLSAKLPPDAEVALGDGERAGALASAAAAQIDWIQRSSDVE